MTNETQTQTSPILGLFVGAFLIVLVLKLSFATLLDLYSDEIFYWWAGTKLSLAYSDLPFMTALLAGIGSGFGPSDSFAVRLCFLILGSLVPLMVYWVAEPISNRKLAMESALLTLCLPLGGFLGLLAVPDVPLIFFGLLAIGFFQRALNHDQLILWIATGIFVALGLSTHYRFFLYPLSAVLFLIFFREERRQWRNWKLWLAIAIASLGLIPILWFNLSNQLSSASFYLVERHPWEFQASGLLHAFKQAGLVTPPLYLLLLYTLYFLFQEAKQSRRDSALLFAFASTNLFVYFILAPWTDANSTSIHWPLSGYFPLLVAVPITIRSMYHWAERRWRNARARQLTILVPALGFVGTLVAFIGVGSQAFQSQLQPLIGRGVLSNKMAGWEEFTNYTAAIIEKDFPNSDPLLVTDNYYTAAQLEFAGVTTNILTIDNDKAIRDGRITQLQLWNKDGSELDNYAGSPLLYINEDSSLNLGDKTALMAQMCQSVEDLNQLDSLSLFAGDKSFSFYQASAVKRFSNTPGSIAFPCPYPMQAWIDMPNEGQSLSSTTEVSGWAYSEDIGIESVQLLLDGTIAAEATYGISRQDVVDVRNISTDPNAPNLGFRMDFDTTDFDNGRYELAISLQNKNGAEAIYGTRSITIKN